MTKCFICNTDLRTIKEDEVIQMVQIGKNDSIVKMSMRINKPCLCDKCRILYSPSEEEVGKEELKELTYQDKRLIEGLVHYVLKSRMSSFFIGLLCGWISAFIIMALANIIHFG